MVDVAFHSSEFDEINACKCCELIVKIVLSPRSGIVALGKVNSICERGYTFF